MREEIKKLIEKAVKETEKEFPDFSIEVPSEKSHGDYSVNVALILAKKSGKNPVELANLIKDKVKSDLFSKIEIAGPGFINFFIKDEFMRNQLK